MAQKGIKFILILCGGTGSQGSKQASDLNRQFRQVDVMLKSAVLFTRWIPLIIGLISTK